jgi:hypothetical protein
MRTSVTILCALALATFETSIAQTLTEPTFKPTSPFVRVQMREAFMQVGGTVLTSRGQPIPGCLVVLRNPEVGDSFPVSTGATGAYFFPQVPTVVQTLYVIEVHWNGQIIFRGLVRHPGLQEPVVIPAG